ncbi:MAG: ATP-binding protein [Leptospiraceae bacterium]|nr:ATP-binding protein [Leptospiraceae bacterium]MCZ8346694.1 ATP-binding protein [Leptospiraceae bacterium]
MKKYIAHTFILLLPLLLNLKCTISTELKFYAKAEKGILDLRTWNTKKIQTVNLDGEWLFNPEFQDYKSTINNPSIIKVPSTWNNHNHYGKVQSGEGIGTYVLKVLLPKDSKNLIFQFNDTSTAFKFYINGVLVKENGRIGKSRTEMVPSYKHPSLILDNSFGDELELCLQISNFYHPTGGLRKSINLSDIQYFNESKKNENAIGWLVFGATFMMGLYHLIIYLMRKSDKSALMFSIFCLDVSFRTFFTGSVFLYEVFPDEYWVYIHKLDLLTFVISLPFFIYFLQSIFPNEVHKIPIKIISFAGIIFVLIVLLSYSNFYMKLIAVYQLLMVVGIIYCIYILIRALLQKREGSVIFFNGSIFLFIIAINDILNQMLIIRTGYYANWGLLIFLFSQTIMLSRRFSMAYYRLEELQKSLDLKVKERTIELENAKVLAENANKLKDKFISLVSHDLKSPIASVIGILSILKSEINEMSNEEKLLFIQRAEMSSRNSLNLIGTLLDINRLQSGEFELELLPYSAFSEVEKVINKLWTQIQEKKIKIENAVDKDLVIEADKNLLNEVFINLLTNSVKFSNKEGRISIECTKLMDGVEFSIQDYGTGIDPSLLPNIFEKEIRTTTLGTFGEPGTGLGLPLIYDIITSFHGMIQINSTKDSGTKITFTIPTKIL